MIKSRGGVPSKTVTVYKITLYGLIFVQLEDKLEQQHALFTQYKDPCRLGPGEDKPWALGNYTHTRTHTLSHVSPGAQTDVTHNAAPHANKQHVWIHRWKPMIRML